MTEHGKDTINDAKKKALDCFNAGTNGSSNPYRNLPASTHNSELFAAFEDEMNSLHFKDSCKNNKSPGLVKIE